MSEPTESLLDFLNVTWTLPTYKTIKISDNSSEDEASICPEKNVSSFTNRQKGSANTGPQNVESSGCDSLAASEQCSPKIGEVSCPYDLRKKYFRNVHFPTQNNGNNDIKDASYYSPSDHDMDPTWGSSSLKTLLKSRNKRRRKRSRSNMERGTFSIDSLKNSECSYISNNSESYFNLGQSKQITEFSEISKPPCSNITQNKEGKQTGVRSRGKKRKATTVVQETKKFCFPILPSKPKNICSENVVKNTLDSTLKVKKMLCDVGSTLNQIEAALTDWNYVSRIPTSEEATGLLSKIKKINTDLSEAYDDVHKSINQPQILENFLDFLKKSEDLHFTVLKRIKKLNQKSFTNNVKIDNITPLLKNLKIDKSFNGEFKIKTNTILKGPNLSIGDLSSNASTNSKWPVDFDNHSSKVKICATLTDSSSSNVFQVTNAKSGSQLEENPKNNKIINVLKNARTNPKNVYKLANTKNEPFLFSRQYSNIKYPGEMDKLYTSIGPTKLSEVQAKPYCSRYNELESVWPKNNDIENTINCLNVKPTVNLKMHHKSSIKYSSKNTKTTEENILKALCANNLSENTYFKKESSSVNNNAQLIDQTLSRDFGCQRNISAILENKTVLPISVPTVKKNTLPAIKNEKITNTFCSMSQISRPEEEGEEYFIGFCENRFNKTYKQQFRGHKFNKNMLTSTEYNDKSFSFKSQPQHSMFDIPKDVFSDSLSKTSSRLNIGGTSISDFVMNDKIGEFPHIPIGGNGLDKKNCSIIMICNNTNINPNSSLQPLNTQAVCKTSWVNNEEGSENMHITSQEGSKNISKDNFERSELVPVHSLFNMSMHPKKTGFTRNEQSNLNAQNSQSGQLGISDFEFNRLIDHHKYREINSDISLKMDTTNSDTAEDIHFNGYKSNKSEYDFGFKERTSQTLDKTIINSGIQTRTNFFPKIIVDINQELYENTISQRNSSHILNNKQLQHGFLNTNIENEVITSKLTTFNNNSIDENCSFYPKEGELLQLDIDTEEFLRDSLDINFTESEINDISENIYSKANNKLSTSLDKIINLRNSNVSQKKLIDSKYIKKQIFSLSKNCSPKNDFSFKIPPRPFIHKNVNSNISNDKEVNFRPCPPSLSPMIFIDNGNTNTIVHSSSHSSKNSVNKPNLNFHDKQTFDSRCTKSVDPIKNIKYVRVKSDGEYLSLEEFHNFLTPDVFVW